MLVLLPLLLLGEASASRAYYKGRVRHVGAPNASTESEYQGQSSCDLNQVEYRLTRLEVQVAEKSENLRSEVREGVRRIQALEWKSAEVQAALENFSSELERLPLPSNNITSDKLVLRVDNLAKGVQVMIAALRGINSDMAVVKRNMSAVVRNTRSLLLNHDALVTKPFLHASLADVRHPLPRSSADLDEDDVPRSCREAQERGHNASGIYRIRPVLAPRAFMVLCDMTTRGGGWAYVLNRFEGLQDFYMNWHSYKQGFGNLGGEFWLGLEHLHQLTGHEVNELLVELVDADLKRVSAHYAAFSVASELEGYALKVLAGYEGDAGDSLLYHAGSKFSTKDVDQDGWPEGNCAQAHTGAWWYKGCDTSNLNGKYLKGDVPEEYLYQGMYWGGFHGAQYSLLRARMMVRPRDVNSPRIFPEEN